MPVDRHELADDEEVLVDARLHWVLLAGPVLLTLAALSTAATIWVEFPNAPLAAAWVLLAMVGLPLLWLAGRVLSWRGVHLVVTATRLVYRRGVLGRDVAQLRLQRVAEVHCTQSLGGRILGSGRLVLEVTGGKAMVVDHVRRPRALQRVIAGLLDRAWSTGYWGADATGAPASASGQWSPDRGWDPVTRAGMPAPGWVPGPEPLGRLPDATPPHGTPAVAGWSRAPAKDPTGRSGGVPAGSGPSGLTGGTSRGVTSVPDQLIRLDQLRRSGIITAEEFEAKKADLLSRL